MKKRKTLFLAAIVFVLCGCKKSSEFKLKNYEDGLLYTAGQLVADGTGIDRVEIDWVAGNVEIERNASNCIVAFEEESEESIEARMHTRIEERVLKIKYCLSGYKGKIDKDLKKLQVEIPRDKEVKIRSISADVCLGLLEAKQLFVETQSGNIEAEQLVCDLAELKTEEGAMHIGGVKAKELLAQSNAGAMHFGLPDSLKTRLENECGEIALYLHGNGCARFLFESEQGKFISERPYQKIQEGIYEFLYGGEFSPTQTQYIQVRTGTGNFRVQ
ncbi:MAG: DUF4097 family beta strand repeat protein [Clostridia bacterium]|nr:DUF4097 family beta strand repeat protein [Clostridia bacterium]